MADHTAEDVKDKGEPVQRRSSDDSNLQGSLMSDSTATYSQIVRLDDPGVVPSTTASTFDVYTDKPGTKVNIEMPDGKTVMANSTTGSFTLLSKGDEGMATASGSKCVTSLDHKGAVVAMAIGKDSATVAVTASPGKRSMTCAILEPKKPKTSEENKLLTILNRCFKSSK